VTKDKVSGGKRGGKNLVPTVTKETLMMARPKAGDEGRGKKKGERTNENAAGGGGCLSGEKKRKPEKEPELLR